MNLHPKLRPLWQRALALPPIAMLAAYKALRLPKFVLPRALRSIAKNWDYRMFAIVLRSRLTRAYIDQPCEFRMPSSVEPKTIVAPEHRFSAEQLRGFYENGFIGPIDAFSEEEMQVVRDEMRTMQNKESETYGWVTPRDRHFESPALWKLMKSPAITERLAQILGPDLLVWRTQLFYKEPHSPAIQWHQASTFMVEDYLDPGIYPPDLSEMFQLTVWVAVDDATLENGCLQFVRGSHDRIRTIKFGGEEGFYNARFSLEFERDESRMIKLPAKSGQFIIFTERCIHGSPPNTTDGYRMAFNLRVIPANVPVYTGKTKYRSVYNGGKYVLDKWGVAVLRGEDRFRLSRAVQMDEPAESNATTVPLRSAA